MRRLVSFKSLSVRARISATSGIATASKQRFLSTVAEIERKFHFNDAILRYCTSNATTSTQVLMCDIYFDNSTYALTTRDMWLRQRNDKLELKWPMLTASKDKTTDHQPSETLVGLDFYQESTDIAKIADVVQKSTDLLIKVPSTKCTMEETIGALAAVGIQPFGTIQTHRVRYNLCMDLPAHLRNKRKSTDRQIKVFVDIDTVKYLLPNVPTNSQAPSTPVHSSHDALRTYQIGEIEFDFSDTPTSNHHSSDDNNTALSDTDQATNAATMQHVFRVMGIEPAPVRGKVLEYLVRFRPDHFEALRKSGQLASKGL